MAGIGAVVFDIGNVLLRWDPEGFYDRVIGLTRHAFSWRAIARRFAAADAALPRWLNTLRAVSTEGAGRIRHYSALRRRLDTDAQVLAYFSQSTNELPDVYAETVKRDLGPLWHWLPEGALHHDHNADRNAFEPAGLRPTPVAAFAARVPAPARGASVVG